MIETLLKINITNRFMIFKMVEFYLLQLCILFSAFASAAAQPPQCSPVSCRSGPNISYPFYVPSLQSSNCGLSGFELNCTDLGPTILRILPGDHQYVIDSISYANQIVRVYDAALLSFNPNTTCLPEITNTTFPTRRFSLFNSTRLHLFPLCARNSSTGLWVHRVICSVQDDDRIWNLAIGDREYADALTMALQLCDTHIVAPVGFGSGNIYTRLRRGFQLKWTAGESSQQPSTSPSPTPFNFSAPPPPTFAGQGNSKKKKILIAAGVSVAVVVTVSAIFIIFFTNKLQKSVAPQKEDAKDQVDIEFFLKNHGNLAPKRYKYSHLKKISNSFSESLGKGGYGSVYKGQLQDGRVVAIKILNEAKGNGEEFINEVSSISRTSHVNVVALLGFCFDGSKRALIYEYMPNGSLDKFIPNASSPPKTDSLGLEKLFEIAVGIARGLEYLHQGCNMRILHFDIKPHNILLDKDMKPKISDFGLSKLCPNRSSIVSMLGARGTAGYIAPEVFSRSFGEVSHKSDVYSYGMMVLEMVVGRHSNVDLRSERSSEMNFSDWIYLNLEQNASEKGVVHVNNIMAEDEGNFLKRKLLIIGLWCIQTDPKNRPSMSRVIEMLEGKLENLQLPPRPYLSQTPISQPVVAISESKSLL